MSIPPAHRLTSANLQAAYPFTTGAPPGNSGPLLGRDLLGASFRFDPWARYSEGEITGPNMLVIGQIGRGKSSFIKTLVWRELAFGRQAWIIDPKGEYEALSAACGSAPIRLGPGFGLCLNPLDRLVSKSRPAAEANAPSFGVDPESGQLGAGDPGAFREALDLLGSITSGSLGRMLTPAERTALDLALRQAGRRRATTNQGRGQVAPTISDVVAALLEPTEEAATAIRSRADELAADGRQIALELRRLVEGDLAGMFDGQTSPEIDLESPVVVLDLSALYRSSALGIVMVCAAAWLHSAMSSGDGAKRLVIVDEAWAVLRDLATARWMQASFKLARSLGGAHIAVVHRLSDLEAAGTAGSEQRALAEGLLADAETRVLFAQPPAECEAARRLLGLSSAEAALLGQLPRGVALWRIGQRSTVVRHIVSRSEMAMVDTDSSMRDVNHDISSARGDSDNQRWER